MSTLRGNNVESIEDRKCQWERLLNSAQIQYEETQYSLTECILDEYLASFLWLEQLEEKTVAITWAPFHSSYIEIQFRWSVSTYTYIVGHKLNTTGCFHSVCWCYMPVGKYQSLQWIAFDVRGERFVKLLFSTVSKDTLKPLSHERVLSCSASLPDPFIYPLCCSYLPACRISI